MDISILSLNGERFGQNAIPNSSGWWKTIDHIDYDGDGDQDLLAGNLGLNSKLKASMESPIYLYLEDFDRNGTIDGVITREVSGKESIFSAGDMLRRQIPSIGSNFSTHKEFSEASPNEVLGKNFIQAEKLPAKELRSGVFINNHDRFHFLPFPNIMQISFIRNFLIKDINLDGSVDILTAGNLFPAAMQEGRYAADRGSVLAGLPDDHRMLPNEETGIFLRGDIRQVKLLNFQGNDLIMATRNNSSIMWFKRK